MKPGPWARIDLDALRANLAICRRAAPGSRIWAVIKADAYGHGIGACAAALADADGLAVARVQEAPGLRGIGIDRPILVLEGAMDDAELSIATAMRLELVVHAAWQAELIQAHLDRNPQPGSVRVWIKVDTGMGRLGLLPAQVEAMLGRLRRLGSALELVGLMTHLANADDPLHPMTAQQCEQARALAERFGLPLSIGNSAGLLAHPAARTDWVRPGIMLYGGSPLLDQAAADLGLKPVMTLASQLIAVRELPRGATVGYGSTYRCPEAMPVGVVAIGYGDGYPRHAPTGTPVLVRDRRAALIGRVSMDMISVDLRNVPDAVAGDPVTLWGQGLPVEEVAAHVGTINYELLCRLSPRVRHVHVQQHGAAAQEPTHAAMHEQETGA
jgi:alanine racemase